MTDSKVSHRSLGNSFTDGNASMESVHERGVSNSCNIFKGQCSARSRAKYECLMCEAKNYGVR